MDLTASAPFVLGVRISVPPGALVPLALISAALLILVGSGKQLQRWKERNPRHAAMFALVVASLCTAGAIYFLAKCVQNQSDPNNKGTGQLSFLDPPIGAFLGALACSFFRVGEHRKIGLGLGILVGVIMIAKPLAFPVSVTFTEGAGVQSKVVTYTRGILDPEHIEFVLSGLVVVVAGLIAGAKPFVPPASRWAERGIQST